MVLIMNFAKHIDVNYTVKRFYKCYSYKICFKIDESKLVTISTRNTWYGSRNQTNVLELRHELKKRVIDKLPDSLECKFRGEGKYLTMFLDDHKIFEDMVNRLGSDITEIYMPANESHRKVMEDNHRVRVRKTLFHNKFRFRVNIKRAWDDKFTDFENLHSWLNTLEKGGGDRWMANIPLGRIFKIIDKLGKYSSTKYYWSEYAVYLNDEQDVMMLQLWLNNYYDSAEKAVLISEL